MTKRPSSEAHSPNLDFQAIVQSDRSRRDRLGEAIDEVYAAVDAGQSPDRERLLEQYADIAEELSDCLRNLDFIQKVAPQLSERADDQSASDGSPISQRVNLGDFRIIREIGRGGMGVVYEAEQLSLGRRIALKVLPFAAMLDKQQLHRFKNEARAAGTLVHPNIVAVHSVSTERGVHYYAMQLVEGQSLAEWIANLRKSQRIASDEADAGAGHAITVAAKGLQAPLTDAAQSPSEPLTSKSLTSPAADTKRDVQAALSTAPKFDTEEYFHTVAELGIQAAQALDHAHQNGIVHRDVKPGNLLVDTDGKLFVTDFGLARIEADAGMTMTGDMLGTLRYMSPEQVEAQRGVLYHRTDIYSLGVTLYELLTLRPAFGGDERQRLLRQILEEEPRRPRQINGTIPTDLETIVLKSTTKEPQSRYATAKELADDLGRFLED